MGNKMTGKQQCPSCGREIESRCPHCDPAGWFDDLAEWHDQQAQWARNAAKQERKRAAQVKGR